MHGTVDAVVVLDVQLGELVVVDGASLSDVSKRRSIDDVPNHKTLHGLVLGHELAGGHAVDSLHVASVLFVSAVVSSLNSHG